MINLEKILGNKCKSVVGQWAKRLVTSAVKGSFKIWLKVGNTLAANMEPKTSWEKMERKDTNRDPYDGADQLFKHNLKVLNVEEPKLGIINDNENKEEGIEILSSMVGKHERMRELINPDICLGIEVVVSDNDESEIEENGKEEAYRMIKEINDRGSLQEKESGFGESEPAVERVDGLRERHEVSKGSSERIVIMTPKGKLFPAQDESDEK
jgi:hypothetical protein